MILLDTDIVVDLLRGHQAAVEWVQGLEDEEIALPGFVAMEVLQGCRTKLDQQDVERRLSVFVLLWPTADSCNAALTAFAQYHLSHGLGLLDALIGQTAASMNLPLHTFNQKHYASMRDLRTVQPYAR